MLVSLGSDLRVSVFIVATTLRRSSRRSRRRHPSWHRSRSRMWRGHRSVPRVDRSARARRRRRPSRSRSTGSCPTPMQGVRVGRSEDHLDGRCLGGVIVGACALQRVVEGQDAPQIKPVHRTESAGGVTVGEHHIRKTACRAPRHQLLARSDLRRLRRSAVTARAPDEKDESREDERSCERRGHGQSLLS